MNKRKSSSVSGSAGWFPSAGGLSTRLAYNRAKAAGIALEPILKKASLHLHQVEDQKSLIRVRDQIIFLDLVSEALGDDLLGFHLAQTPDLREIGLLYYVLASSKTLTEILQRAERYSSMVNEGISLKCKSGNAFGISFH
jgi:Arabinose-binding domain of AraC transcription regulator, N-term